MWVLKPINRNSDQKKRSVLSIQIRSSKLRPSSKRPREHSRATSHADPESEPEIKEQTEALSGGMEEAYRSPMGTIGDQGRVPNSLQYTSSYGQAAKFMREKLKETSRKRSSRRRL
ncbi:hypothetical protein AYI70_g3540 [Smittium culicis]|uniref:Uncharacterized protein n=1 Tax=Smittium culicis TaxID=133412 RepID=A0A1R1Y3L4_9FUNG|nr:hypothetical protein AYI70_g3540 [Smittium culicis]